MKKHLEFYKGGCAYLLMMGLTYTLGTILILLASYVIAKIAGIPYDYEQIMFRDDFSFVVLVISQLMFLIAMLPFFGGFKRAKDVCAFNKPQKKLDFVMAIILGIGMFLGLTIFSDIFIRFLGLFGYTPTPSPFPDVESHAGNFLTSIFIVCVIPAFFEETFFRGILLDSLRNISDWFAVIFSAVMFMLVHASPLQTLYQLAAGFMFAIVAVKSNSILPGMVMHFLNNFYAVLLEYIGLGDIYFPVYAIILGWVLIALSLIYFLTKKEPKMTFKRQKDEVSRLADDDRLNDMLVKEKKGAERTNNLVGILTYAASIVLCVILWITQFIDGLV